MRGPAATQATTSLCLSSFQQSRDVTTDIYINIFLFVLFIYLCYIFILYIYLLFIIFHHPPSAVRHPPSIVHNPHPPFVSSFYRLPANRGTNKDIFKENISSMSLSKILKETTPQNSGNNDKSQQTSKL